MADKEKMGVVYVLTNPAMPGWVKIGYADDLKNRLKSLNNSTAVPLPFEVYAYYETPFRLVDKNIQDLIDTINSELRAVTEVEGRQRKREFYHMKPDQAYHVLYALAGVHNRTDAVVLVQENNKSSTHSTHKSEIHETHDDTQKEKDGGKRVSKEAISFTKCGIPEGAELTYDNDSSIKAYVKGKNKVIYNNEEYSLTGLTKKIRNDNTAVRGPMHWKYKGELLTDIRERKEQEGTYK